MSTLSLCTSCVIIDCGGAAGCYQHHLQGRGIHCDTCNGEGHYDDPVSHSDDYSGAIHRVIDCRGYGCQILSHGVHCEHCFGVLPEELDPRY